jgi:hypothetical protein
MNPTAYKFDDDDIYAGSVQLDASYRVPFKEDMWAYPINSVGFAPPPHGEHETAKINASRTAWLIIPDWRGHKYWLPDRSSHTITVAGVEPPVGSLSADPGPSIADVKATRLAEISSACEAEIIAGFESSALGQAYTYPCKLTDQSNLMASVSAAREPGLPDTWRAPFWCQDASGAWSYQFHTAEQIRQVGMDGYTATLSKLQHKAALESFIELAETIDAVEGITWSYPPTTT